jgi:cell division protein ZapA (FtsZ GTPase activity inhibitor)
MSGEGMANRYDVNIAGYALTVMSERSPEHMARLAETLNGRVRDLQRSGGTANYLHIVMLAAMELADELLDVQDRAGDITEKARESVERAARLEAETSVLREELRRLGEEARAVREEVEALRKERESLRDRVERKSKDLLATLDSALK